MAFISLQTESVRFNSTSYTDPDGRQSLKEALMARFSAHEIGDAIEVLIDVLDALNGDPDLEEDDPTGQDDEDGINTGPATMWRGGFTEAGPGCTMSDDDRDDGGIQPIYGVDQSEGPLRSIQTRRRSTES